MFKALVYKEWLKIRWTYLSLCGISLVTVIYIFLGASHDIELEGAVNVWAMIIYQKYPFFSDLNYIPFITGIIIGLVQFYPEINSGRLKLTLHLPVKENKILLQMILIGGGLILFLQILTQLVLILFTLSYFPVEIVRFELITLAPSFLVGLISYFCVASIMVEPVWVRRIPMMIFFGGLCSMLFGSGEYSYTLLLFMALTGCCVVLTIVLSGFYFKRGIK